MPTLIRDTFERVGYTDNVALMTAIVSDLTEKGLFTQVFPATAWDGTGAVILEPTAQVDVLFVKPDPARGIAPTSWRLAFSIDSNKVIANVATSIQLQDDGTVARATWDAEAKNPGEFVLVDRSHLDVLGQSVYPMSYAYSISDHGLFLGIWDQSTDEYQDERNYVSPSFRWFAVQRPVAHDTGEVMVTGHQPVFCVYTVIEEGMVALRDSQIPNVAPKTGATAGSNFDVEINGVFFRKAIAQFHRRFTVREKDVYRPSLAKPADMNSEDGNAILNSTYQVSISEDHRYVVTIPKGLNTTRFSYPQELDMIAFTSADVVGHTSVVDVPTYGATYRFRAMPANRTRNTGMRILCRVKADTTP